MANDIIPSVRTHVLKTRPTLQSYVVGKLGLGWSPEQFAGRLRKEYIYDEPQSELRLWEKLPRRHRKRRRWLGRKSRPVKIPNRLSIRERPEDVNSRRDFGHWEGDTVVGDQHKSSRTFDLAGSGCYPQGEKRTPAGLLTATTSDIRLSRKAPVDVSFQGSQETPSTRRLTAK